MKRTTPPGPRAKAPSPARRHKASDERRAEIAAATMAILAEEGLHAWTTSALARRVGVSEACLFRHYPAKEDILADAVGRAAEELCRRIEAYRPAGDAWQGARGLVLTLLEFVEQTGGAPLVVLSGHAAPVSRGLQGKAAQVQGLLHARMTGLFLRAQTGRRSRARAARLANLAIAVTQSAGMRWMISGRTLPLRPTAMDMFDELKRCLSDERGAARAAPPAPQESSR